MKFSSIVRAKLAILRLKIRKSNVSPNVQVDEELRATKAPGGGPAELSSLERLPYDILVNIFSELDVHDVFTLSRVRGVPRSHNIVGA